MAREKLQLNCIARILREQGRYQNRLAVKLGIRDSIMSSWCTQTSQPPLEWLFAIAEVLDVSVSELINQEFKYNDPKFKVVKKINPLKKSQKQSEPMKKIIAGLRHGLHNVVKKRNEHLNTSVLRLLGCTSEQLSKHLESRFTPKMTWENYGEWHVDHIKPISSFHFTSQNDPEFLECWALSNLQPLWATTRVINGVEYMGNLNKSAKIISPNDVPLP